MNDQRAGTRDADCHLHTQLTARSQAGQQIIPPSVGGRVSKSYKLRVEFQHQAYSLQQEVFKFCENSGVFLLCLNKTALLLESDISKRRQ